MLNIPDILKFFDCDNSSCISQLITSELGELQKSHSIFLREPRLLCLCFIIIFIYLSFISQTFTILRTVGEEGDYLFNSYILIPTASQKLRYQSGNYCREFISALSHCLDPDFVFKAQVRNH